MFDIIKPCFLWKDCKRRSRLSLVGIPLFKRRDGLRGVMGRNPFSWRKGIRESITLSFGPAAISLVRYHRHGLRIDATVSSYNIQDIAVSLVFFPTMIAQNQNCQQMWYALLVNY